MSPPCFNRLDHQARSIFFNYYYVNVFNLKVLTQTSNGLQFHTNADSDNDTKKVSANLEIKSNSSNYGLACKQTWNTENKLNTQISVKDNPFKGFKLGLTGTYSAIIKKFTHSLNFRAKSDSVHLTTDIDFVSDFKKPVVHGSLVIGRHEWLAGTQVTFDPITQKLLKSSYAIAYHTPEFVLHTSVSDGSEYSGSIYQQVNNKLESGIMLSWSTLTNTSTFGIGCIYKLNSATHIRGKINNNSQIGIGITHFLQPGIVLSLCSHVEGGRGSTGLLFLANNQSTLIAFLIHF